MQTIKPILVFGYGNQSRGDDALGPLFLEHIYQEIDSSMIEFQTDFQLQIEHALDLEYRDLILFVDATEKCNKEFTFEKLTAENDRSYSTHAISPNAVMQVFLQIKGNPPPPCFLLSIHGIQFELGANLSQDAEKSLDGAVNFGKLLFERPDYHSWLKLSQELKG